MSKRRLIIVGIITASAAILLAVQTLIKDPNVGLTVSPSEATIVIDGNMNVKEGRIYLSPGSHELVASMEGFSTKVIKFNVQGSKFSDVLVLLVPDSTEGVNWLIDHPQEAIRREGLGGGKFVADISEKERQLPLIKDLPFIDRVFRIDYGPSLKNPEDSNAIAIYVKYYTEAGKNEAVEWIKFRGYDPSKLELVYRDAYGE
ncbi:MAG: hypothetical protein WD877_00620 [Candidatus Saccharimonadales bacterium]